MKTIDKTANLSRAKIVLKKHAITIIEILKSKGVKIIKKSEDARDLGCFCWHGHIPEKNENAKIHICITRKKFYVDFIAKINYQKRFCDETDLKKIVRRATENTVDEKYPLSNLCISVTVRKPKVPKFNQREIARQLYLALKYHNKITNLETELELKKVSERVRKFTESEADRIVGSFFREIAT